jgi:hypothetical protein
MQCIRLPAPGCVPARAAMEVVTDALVPSSSSPDATVIDRGGETCRRDRFLPRVENGHLPVRTRMRVSRANAATDVPFANCTSAGSACARLVAGELRRYRSCSTEIAISVPARSTRATLTEHRPLLRGWISSWSPRGSNGCSLTKLRCHLNDISQLQLL